MEGDCEIEHDLADALPLGDGEVSLVVAEKDNVAPRDIREACRAELDGG